MVWGSPREKFENAWMRIATIDAEENPYSPIFHRKKAGQKGIGRIACNKLAKVVSIVSVSRGESGKKIKISSRFRWDSFLPGSDAQTKFRSIIKLKMYRIPNLSVLN